MPGNLTHATVSELRDLSKGLFLSNARLKDFQFQFDRVAELLTAEKKYNEELRSNIITKLCEMDCASNGNTGWHNRIVWMLAELMKPEETK